jgi:glycosyltransferase involved in cell wall biosynthesis
MSELVSVIIPVYNSAQFLNESLESVINQTYSNIEIICVNDGSTDNSLEILQQYSDKITIISQENHGLASALNLGIRKMKGIWFKWFSPDDIMFSNTIEQLVDAAKHFSDNVIVYSNWQIINENGNILRNFSESNYNELSKFDFNIRLLSGQQINVNTSLIPFSLIENKCSFRNLEEPVAIDYDFFLRAALLFDTKFYFIEKQMTINLIFNIVIIQKIILKDLKMKMKTENIDGRLWQLSLKKDIKNLNLKIVLEKKMVENTQNLNNILLN